MYSVVSFFACVLNWYILMFVCDILKGRDGYEYLCYWIFYWWKSILWLIFDVKKSKSKSSLNLKSFIFMMFYTCERTLIHPNVFVVYSVLGSRVPFNTLTGVIDGNTVYGVTEEFGRSVFLMKKICQCNYTKIKYYFRSANIFLRSHFKVLYYCVN